MKTNTRRLASALLAAVLAMVATPLPSFGQGTINVYAFSAPANLPSQDSYAALFLSNVEQGMQTGNWPVGSSLNPAYASPITSGNVSVLQTIYTPSSFSWNGVANPSGTFASQHGQLLLFGANIQSSTLFTLNQVGWSLGYPLDNQTNSGTLAGVGYSQIGIGINWGPDGIPGTADDIVYTSGNGSSPVNQALILYSGWGMTVSGNQSPQSAATFFTDLYKGSAYPVIGGYSLGNVHGSETISVIPTPEPSSLVLLGIGGGTLALIFRKKRLA